MKTKMAMNKNSLKSNIEKQEMFDLVIEVALKTSRKLRKESRKNFLDKVSEVLENPQHKYYSTPTKYILMLLRELDEEECKG